LLARVGVEPSGDAFNAIVFDPHAKPVRPDGERQAIPVEWLVDRVLSMSSSSPERVGNDKEAMGVAIREAVTPFAVDGLIREAVEARAEVFER